MIMPLWLIYRLPLLHEANYCMTGLFQSGMFTYNPYDPLVTCTYPYFTLRPHTAARFQFQSSPEVTTVTGVSNVM